MNNKYKDKITELSELIAKEGESRELLYTRGYYFFLSDETESAKQDYLKAIEIGLDVTEFPYYSFSNSNSFRREFILPEKIMVFLVLLMVSVAIIFQTIEFLARFR